VTGEWFRGISPSRETPLEFDTSVAHPARVYDYWLGGKDNFAADREAGERVIAAQPAILDGVRANRAFLGRAVRYLAQAVVPSARVVYVDNDPIVLAHARALLTSTRGPTSYIDADVRDTSAILKAAGRTLDFDQPVAVMLLMIMHLIPDSDDPYGIVTRLLDAVPSGSYLVLSHPASDIDTAAAARATQRYNKLVATPQTRRSRAEVTRFFEGLDLLDPGVVQTDQWRPEPDADPGGKAPGYAAVGRKA
jgi:hypothetical protein